MTKGTSNKKNGVELFSNSDNLKKIQEVFEDSLKLIGKKNTENTALFKEYFELATLNGLLIMSEGLTKGYKLFKNKEDDSDKILNEQARKYISLLVSQVKDAMTKRNWMIENA